MKDYFLNDNNDNIEENMSYNPELTNRKVFDDNEDTTLKGQTPAPGYQRGIPPQYPGKSQQNRVSVTPQRTSQYNQNRQVPPLRGVPTNKNPYSTQDSNVSSDTTPRAIPVRPVRQAPMPNVNVSSTDEKVKVNPVQPMHNTQPAHPQTPLTTPNIQGMNPQMKSQYNYPANPYNTPINRQGYSEFYNNFPQTQTSPETSEKKKKKNGGLIAIIVIIILIFLGLIGAFVAMSMGMFGDSGKEGNSSNITSDTTTSDTGWGIGNDTDVTDPNNGGINMSDQPEIDVKEYSAQQAYNVLSPSVVGISCYEKGLVDITQGPASEGTGIILTENGYIATNSHVIGDSKTTYEVYVLLSDGSEHEAKIVGFDSKTDLAVLKINTKGLPVAPFADSEAVVVGQEVVAIGNPGGSEYSNSITKGIVSAVNRSVSTYSYVNYIQTDAAINPGNSGGPLANLYGQVIGINTIKIVSEEYEGMGFAIPSKVVKDICDDLITQGYVSNRVRIGITGQEISEASGMSHGVPSGILIVGFSSDSPFNGTDARVEDIITAFNGVEISSFSELYKELDKYKPGDEVTVTLYRQTTTGSGLTLEVKIKLLADLGETQRTDE